MSPLAVAIAALVTATQPLQPDLATPPPPEEPSPYLAQTHVEIVFGFVGSLRDESRADFAFEGGDAASTPFAAALAAPFSASPYDSVPAYGVSAEMRYVSHHLRFTTGVQKPFTSFRLTDAVGTYDVGGVGREVGTRSLSLWDLRFGVGTEWGFRYVAPFVDLIGDVQSVSAALVIDGQTANYRAWSFGFSVRAGLRINVGDNMFIAPAGEWGLGGAVKFGASLQAGWVLPIG